MTSVNPWAVLLLAKKNISVEIQLHEHGVKRPLLEQVKFSFHREVLDEDGIYNPVDDKEPYEGAFQININADSEGYRELGKYFLGLAEYGVGKNEGFHQHHEGLISADGRTRLHIIVRKDESWSWHTS